MTAVLSANCEPISTTKQTGEHRNLTLVSGVWYIQARINGRRIAESTHVSDLSAARQIRDARLAQAVIEGITGRPSAPVNGRAYTPIATVLQTYKTAALVHGLPERTTQCYASALRQLLKASGVDPDSATAAALTGDLVRNYVASRKILTKRDRVTARSTLRQARAIFAKWTADEDVYTSLCLPDLTQFRAGCHISQKGECNVYTPRPPELVEATKTAAAKLPPNLKAVWYLAYGMGLRAGEIVSARWDWVAPDGDGRPSLHIVNRPDYTLKGVRPRSIPFPDVALQHLQGIRQGPHLLPCATHGARRRLIKWLNTWMRGIGWDRATYSKGVHELRKLRGSEWYTLIAPAYASAMLGHTSLRTTEQFYACYNRGHDPLPC